MSATVATVPRTPSSRGSSASRSTRPRWSSSVPPATCRGASCCPPSTTSPTRGRCPSASSSSASRARTCPTATSGPWPRRRSSSFSRREPDDAVLDRLLDEARYVPGTFDDLAVYETLEQTLRRVRSGRRPADESLLLPLDRAELLPGDRGQARRARPEPPLAAPRCASSSRSRSGRRWPRPSSSTARCCRSSTSSRSSASTTTWARRRSRTSWPSGSPTGSSSRCGTATTSTTSRSRPPRTSGSGPRAGYYDSAGALRDLIQNHMLQLLCNVAMEPPVSFTADEVRNEKVKVLHAIRAPTPEDLDTIAVRAQYAEGESGGEHVGGYLQEEGVRAGLQHRDLRGPAPGGRQLALGRRPLLPAHGQAPRAQGHGDRDHAQAGPSPGLLAGGLARGQAQPAHPHACSPTRASRSRWGPRSRARACASVRSSWSSSTGRRSCRSRRRPTSG